MAKIFKLRFCSDLFKRLFASALPMKIMKKSSIFGKIMKQSISCVITPRGFISKNTMSHFFQTGNFEPLCRKPLLGRFHLNLHKRISSTDSQGRSTQIFSMIIDCEAMDMLGYDISLFHGYSHFLERQVWTWLEYIVMILYIVYI